MSDFLSAARANWNQLTGDDGNTEPESTMHGTPEFATSPTETSSQVTLNTPAAPPIVGADIRPSDTYKDMLLLEFPAYKDKINKARSFNISDAVIRKEMAERERQALSFGISQDAIDREIGRTPASKIESYNEMRYRQAHVLANLTGKPTSEIEKRLSMAQYVGMSPNLLVQNDKLYQKVAQNLEEQGVKMTEKTSTQMKNAFLSDILHGKKSSIFTNAARNFRGPTEKEWGEIAALDAEIARLAPPVLQTTWQEAVSGTSGFAAQQLGMFSHGAKRAIQASPIVALGAASVGGASGPLAPVTATGTLASGLGLAYKMGAMEAGISREFGAAFEEFLKIKDENGNRIDPKLALIFAAPTGLLSAGMEYMQFKGFGRMLSRGFTPSQAAGALANAVFRNRIISALKESGIDYTKEIGQETLQRAIVILGRELVSFVSGPEYQTSSVGGIIGELADEARGAALSFAIPGVLGATGNVVGKEVAARLDPNKVASIAREAAINPEVLKVAAEASAIEEDILTGRVDPDAPIGDNYVFVPKAAVDGYFQTATDSEMSEADALDRLGMDPESFSSMEGEEEIAVSKEKYNELIAQNPGIAEALKNDVREGVSGKTVREHLDDQRAKLTQLLEDPLNADTNDAVDARALRDEIYQQALDTGLPSQEARDGATLWADHVLIVANESGMLIEEASNLTVKKATPEMEELAARGELTGILDSIDRDLDLTANVPIVEIAGESSRTISNEDRKNLVERFGDGVVNNHTGIRLILSSGKHGAGHVRHTAVIKKGQEKAVLMAAFHMLPELARDAIRVKATEGQKRGDAENRGRPGSVMSMHRFLVPVRYGDSIYILKLTAKEYVGRENRIEIDLNDPNAITANLYDQNIAKEISDASQQAEVEPQAGRQLKASDISEISIGEMAVNVKDTFDDKPYLTKQEYEDRTGNKYPYLFQQQTEIRGMFTIDEETGQRVISLFKAKNPSTFVHEIGHVMLVDLRAMAESDGASETIVQDWKTMKEFLGIQDGETTISRAQHEKFADGFLNFIYKGTAPSKALESVFARFKNWLSRLFRLAYIQDIKMSNEVMAVYGRLIATPQATDAAYRSRTTVGDVAAEHNSLQEEINATREALNILLDEDGAALMDLHDRMSNTPEWDTGIDEREAVSVPDVLQAIREDFSLSLNSADLVDEYGDLFVSGLPLGIDSENGHLSADDLARRFGYKDGRSLLQAMTEAGDTITNVVNEQLVNEWDRILQEEELSEEQRSLLTSGREDLAVLTQKYDELKSKIAEQSGGGVTEEIANLRSALHKMLAFGYMAVGYIGDLRREIEDDTKIIKIYSRDVDRLLKQKKVLEGKLQSTKDKLEGEQVRRRIEVGDAKQEIKEDTRIIRIYSRKMDKLLKKDRKLQDNLEIASILLKDTELRRKLASRLAASLERQIVTSKVKTEVARETNKALREIVKASNDKKVIYHRMTQIQQILSGYDLKKRAKKTLDRRHNLEAFVSAFPDAKDDLTKDELKYLGTTSISEMTLDELNELCGKITALRDLGRRELTLKRTAEIEEVARLSREQIDNLGDLAGRAPVIFSGEDIKKTYDFEAGKQDEIRRRQAMAVMELDESILEIDEEITTEEYAELHKKAMTDALEEVERETASNIARRIKRKVEFASDTLIAAGADRHRLFDLLDGGEAKFDGANYKFWIGEFNECRDNYLVELDRRTGESLEVKMKELGVDGAKLNERVRLEGLDIKAYFAGKFPTKSQLMGIYVLSKDPQAMEAVLGGNLNGVPLPEGFVQRCITKLSQNEKALADYIYADLTDKANFDRANDVRIDVENKGMTWLEYYVPIFRIERRSFIRTIDQNESASFIDDGNIPQKVEPGFTHERENIARHNQGAVETDLLKLFYRHVQDEEHFIAYGQTLKKARNILLWNDPDRGGNVGFARSVNERFGSHVYKAVIKYYNDNVTPDIYKAQEVLDGVIGTLLKNKAVMALWLNVGSILKNYASMGKWFIDADVVDILSTLHEYSTDKHGLYEEVFALDPQIAMRKGSAVYEMMRQKSKATDRWIDKAIDLGIRPNAVIDKFVSTIMFKSVFKKQLRMGADIEQARKAAQESVQRNMQPATAMELPDLWRRGGLWRTALLFSSEGAKQANIMLYDTPAQAMAEGGRAGALKRIVAVAIGAMALRLITYGGPDEDDDEGWAEWSAAAIVEGSIGGIPIIGEEIMQLIDGTNYGGDRSLVGEPVRQLFYGVKKLLLEDENEMKKSGLTTREEGMFALLNAYALLKPFPYITLRRLYISAKADDFLDALLTFTGNRRALDRVKKQAAQNW